MIASWGFIYRVRRAIAGLLPIAPHPFGHTVAITTVVALTLIFIVPLLILSGPPALVIADTIMIRLLAERGYGGLLLSDLSGLVWMIPASFLAVGCGCRPGDRPQRVWDWPSFCSSLSLYCLSISNGCGIRWTGRKRIWKPLRPLWPPI